MPRRLKPTRPAKRKLNPPFVRRVDPSPEEIARITKEIQGEWDAKTEYDRTPSVYRNPPAEVKQFRSPFPKEGLTNVASRRKIAHEDRNEHDQFAG